MSLLTLEALEVGYGGRALLPPISLEVRPGELWAVVGRNGSGKSTLLRTLLGLLPRIGGEARVDPRLGYVPQRSDLDPSVPMRVLDLVRAGLDRGRSFLRPGLALRSRAPVEQALVGAGVGDLRHRQFATLSEGQKQRVLLARALVTQPRLLVLDEPTAAMDVVAERAAFDQLDQLRRARELGVLIVAHHVSLLATRSTHMLYLNPECGVVAAGPTAVVAGTADFVHHFGRLLDEGPPP